MKFHVVSITVVLMGIGTATAAALDFQLTSAVKNLTDFGRTKAASFEIGGCDGGCDGGSCDTAYDSGCLLGSCSDTSCGTCGNEWMYFVDFEATYFRYHRADGVQLGNLAGNQDLGVEFDFEFSPRITAGFYGCDGFGVRARYWQFDHAQPAFNPNFGAIGVDTYNIDIEFVDLINLTCYTNIELFAGLRYNDFDENIVNELQNIVINVNSSAYGGLAGLQVNRTAKWGGSFFGRARAAVLMDDGHVFDSANGQSARLDTTQAMLEIASGFEFATCLGPAVFKLTLAAEVQNWFNFSANFDTGTGASFDPFTDVDGPSDVGFGGLVVGVSLEY